MLALTKPSIMPKHIVLSLAAMYAHATQVNLLSQQKQYIAYDAR